MRITIFLKYVCVALLGFLLAAEVTHGQEQFMTLPFADETVRIQNASLYHDGTEHWGAGYALDFVSGVIDNSATWSTFGVHAAASGVAIRAYQKGYGNFVLIRHDEADSLGRRYYSLYAHLDSVESDIPSRSRYDTNFASWRRVQQGEKVGMAGSTGKVVCNSGNCIHLHFEVFRGGYFANPIDPYDVSVALNKFGRDAYPPLAYPGCGASRNWTQCPPVVRPVVDSDVWYMSFVEGDPGVPGDGVFVSSLGGGASFFYEASVSGQFSLSDAEDGITISVFPPPGVELWDFGIGIQVSFRHRNNSSCGTGIPGNPSSEFRNVPTPIVNGVQGRAVVATREGIQAIVDSPYLTCNGPVAPEDMIFHSLFVYDSSINALLSLDAVAVGSGEDAFPEN